MSLNAVVHAIVSVVSPADNDGMIQARSDHATVRPIRSRHVRHIQSPHPFPDLGDVTIAFRLENQLASPNIRGRRENRNDAAQLSEAADQQEQSDVKPIPHDGLHANDKIAVDPDPQLSISRLLIAGSRDWHFCDAGGNWLFTSGLGFRRSPCCSFFHLPYLFFHFLARLECHNKLLWNKNFVASSWVASLSSRSFLDFEHSKIPQFNSTVFDERFDDGIKRLLNDLLCLELCEPNRLGNIFYDFFLGHG